VNDTTCSSNIGGDTTGSSSIGGDTTGSSSIGGGTTGSSSIGGDTTGSGSIDGDTTGSSSIGGELSRAQQRGQLCYDVNIEDNYHISGATKKRNRMNNIAGMNINGMNPCDDDYAACMALCSPYDDTYLHSTCNLSVATLGMHSDCFDHVHTSDSYDTFAISGGRGVKLAVQKAHNKWSVPCIF
jgi:hypothetical protein